MPELFRDEMGLPDALAERGMDPAIKIWNDPDVDWEDSGLVIVRSVADYAQDRDAFIRWSREVPKILNHKDVLEWNTDKHYLRELEALGMPTIQTSWLEPEQKLSKHQIHTRFPASGEFIIKPAVSSGVRDIGRYTSTSTPQRQEAIQQVISILQGGRSVMIQRYVEEVDTLGEISLVFFNGLVSHAVEKRPVLHPSSVTDPTMREAVVTAHSADNMAWQWGEQIRMILHKYVRSRIGRDEQFLFNRVDVVPDGQGSFKVMEISLVDADLYLGATPEALDNFADAIAMRAFW